MRMCAAAVVAATLAVAAVPSQGAVFNPETFTLDNGMEVVVITNRRAPVVSHWVWYRVGSADSPLGKSGLPHFVEHLMFKGTETIEPGEFSKIVARNGGQDNAQTSQDYTAYFQNIASDRLQMVMEMEADRMINLQLDDTSVLPERDVVLEERRSRVENSPGARFYEQMTAAQFLNHPYGNPVIGWMHEMETYSTEDSMAFYRDWYAPNNAILVVAGDIDAATLKPMAEATYGKIPARQVNSRNRVQEPPQEAARRLELNDPRVAQPQLSRTYLAPSQLQAGWETAHSLDVLAEIIGGGGTSRLYRSLVIDQALAADAGAYYRRSSVDDTTFSFYASPREGVSLEDLEAALDTEIAKLLADGVTEIEVERAKKRMVAESVYARDSVSGAARIFGAALSAGMTVEDIESWPERTASVTVSSLNEAARSTLALERSVTGYLRQAQDDQASAGPGTATQGQAG